MPYNSMFLFKVIAPDQWCAFAQRSVPLKVDPWVSPQEVLGGGSPPVDSQHLYGGPLTKQQRKQLPLKNTVSFKIALTQQLKISQNETHLGALPVRDRPYRFLSKPMHRIALLGKSDLETQLRAMLYVADLNYRFSLQPSHQPKKPYRVPLEMPDKQLCLDEKKEKVVFQVLSPLLGWNEKHSGQQTQVGAQTLALALAVMACSPRLVEKVMTVSIGGNSQSVLTPTVLKISPQCDAKLGQVFMQMSPAGRCAFFQSPMWTRHLLMHSQEAGKWVNYLFDCHKHAILDAIHLLSHVFSGLPIEAVIQENSISHDRIALPSTGKSRHTQLMHCLKTGLNSQYIRPTYCAYFNTLMMTKNAKPTPSSYYLMGRIQAHQWLEFIQKAVCLPVGQGGERSREQNNTHREQLLCGPLTLMHNQGTAHIGFKLRVNTSIVQKGIPYSTIYGYTHHPHFSLTIFGQPDLKMRLQAQLYAMEFNQRLIHHQSRFSRGTLTQPQRIRSLLSHKTVSIEMGEVPYTDEQQRKDFLDVLAQLKTKEHENWQSYFKSNTFMVLDNTAPKGIGTEEHALALMILALKDPYLSSNPLNMDTFSYPPRKYADPYHISLSCESIIQRWFSQQMTSVTQSAFFENPMWVKLLLTQTQQPGQWVCRFFKCYQHDTSATLAQLTAVFSRVSLEKVNPKHGKLQAKKQRRTGLLNDIVADLTQSPPDGDVLKKNQYIAIVRQAYFSSILPDMVMPHFNVGAYQSILPFSGDHLINTLSRLALPLRSEAGERFIASFMMNAESYNRGYITHAFTRCVYTSLFFHSETHLHQHAIPRIDYIRQYNGLNQLLIYIGDNVRKDPVVKKMAKQYLEQHPDFLYRAIRAFNSKKMQKFHTGQHSTGPAPLLNYIKICLAADNGQGYILLSQLKTALTELAKNTHHNVTSTLLPAVWQSMLVGMKKLVSLGRQNPDKKAHFANYLFGGRAQNKTQTGFLYCSERIAERMCQCLFLIYAWRMASPRSFWFRPAATIILSGILMLAVGGVCFAGLYFHWGGLSTVLLSSEKIALAVIGHKIGLYALVACALCAGMILIVATVQYLIFQCVNYLWPDKLDTQEVGLFSRYLLETPFVFVDKSATLNDHHLPQTRVVKPRHSFSIYSVSSTFHAETALYPKMHGGGDTPSSVDIRPHGNNGHVSFTYEDDTPSLNATPTPG